MVLVVALMAMAVLVVAMAGAVLVEAMSGTTVATMDGESRWRRWWEVVEKARWWDCRRPVLVVESAESHVWWRDQGS